MKNIILVGFMGTGKTAVAKVLAEKLKRKYVSTDGLIEAREKRSIKDIFAKEGEKYFREVESAVIRNVCKKNGQVIDAGGGAILDPANLATFRKNGVVVCLWASPEVILERTKRNDSRPLLNVEDPIGRIKTLLEYRRPFYNESDLHVDTSECGVEEAASRIESLLKRKKSRKTGDAVSPGLWKHLLVNLLENVESAIMVTAPGGEIVFANHMFKEYFSLREEAFFGNNWIELLVPEYAQKEVKESFKEIMKRKFISKIDLPVVSGKRREEHFHWVISPLKGRTKTHHTMFIGRATGKFAKKVSEAGAANETEILDVIFAGSEKGEPETAKHSLRVMSFSVALAEKVGLKKEDIKVLKIASLLHDIGKLVLDEKILFKKGRLQEDEFAEVKKHPDLSAEIIEPIAFLGPILPIIVSHHENYDGSGYPRGLKGKKIPIGARILSIADVYEALTTDRPYRKAFTKEEALRIIESAKGWKLDPELTDIFLKIVRKGELEEDEC